LATNVEANYDPINGRASIVFTGVKMEIAGRVQLIVENLAGTDSCKTEVTVLGQLTGPKQEQSSGKPFRRFVYLSGQMYSVSPAIKPSRFRRVFYTTSDLAEELPHFLPPKFLEPLPDQRVHAGASAIFPLVITGAPQPSLAWYARGVELQEGGRIEVSLHIPGHTLMICVTDHPRQRRRRVSLVVHQRCHPGRLCRVRV
jgi:hypothetical protein